jgi:5-methylcytosine-specific restriction endonuclease McrA
VWRKNNAHKKAAQQAKRRAQKRDATPIWLTEDMLKEIEYIYFLASDVGILTGEEYHVDHIIPINGDGICGMHVPWNLQVISKDDNLRKSNKWSNT